MQNSQFKIDSAAIKCVLASKVSTSSFVVWVCVWLQRWDNQEEAASFSEVGKKKKKTTQTQTFKKCSENQLTVSIN